MTEKSPTKHYLVALTALLMTVSIVNVADKELLAPVVDAVKIDLEMSDTQVGAVRSAVFLAALLGQFIWGPLSDRWVRKYIIATGTVIWSAVTWMTAFVSGFPQLLLARASMSFAEGCFNPSAYALITDSTPKHRHGLVLGLMSLTYPVGTAAALVVASLIGTAHWRQPFIYYGIIGIVLGALVLWIVREPRRGANEEAVQEVQGEYVGRFSLKEFARVLKVPSLWLAFGLDSCQASINWSFAFWAPTYLTRYKIAPDAETAALALLPAILGFVLGALLGGWLIDRLRQRTVLAPAWVSLAAMSGGLVMALVVFNVFSLVPLMTAAFFLGLATYMVMPGVSVTLFSVVPPETKATTISASNILLNLVISALSLVIGMVSDAIGLRIAFGGVIVVMYILGIIVSLALLRRYRVDLERRDALVGERVIAA
ncbi:MAG: MFS transporter [Anaerolineales bacterium]|nr:MFS transporter [Anaerolineales bacterium]